MVTTTKTNASAPDYVLTLSVFTRDGQTNLVRSILTRPDKVESPSHKFYHEGFLVGEIKSIANFYVFTGAADCPYSLEGYYRTNGGIWQAAICTKDGVVLDYFTATNGLFWPAPRSEIQNLSKMTTAMNRQHAKALENSPKMTTRSNHFSGAVAGCAPEFIEMIQVVPSRKSGAAHFWGR